MEEGTEAHMETDVSSTTEDVSEAQEVTGSNGNVEMIVIVEKVTDEEQSSQQGDSQLPVPSSEGDTTTKVSPHTTPTKLQSISPVKVAESQKTPVKPQLAETPTKNTQLIEADVVSLSPDQSEAVVDSSSKTEIQETSDKTPVIGNSSPAKHNEVDIDLKTSQNTSPVKLPVSSSPVKDQPQQTTKPSPVKETPSQETVKSTPSQEDPEITTLNGKIQDTEKPQDDKSEKSVSSQMDVDKEATNESISETHSEASEKEHKGISRELKSLIKSAKESKIISECTQLTSKTRKSRAPLDTSNTSLNISVEADKILDKRRNSDNSQKSTCSEKSDKVPMKRSMRSQNPEFVSKVKQFLNSVTSKVQKESDDGTDEDVEETKSKECKVNPVSSSPKKKKVADDIVQEKTLKLRTDPYCWRCHWAVEQAPNEKTHPPMGCTVCPRVYHYKCLNGVERNKINTEKSWVCPECMGVLHAESSETRSPAMKKISLGKLQELLKHAMERMVDLNGIEPFLQPVDRTQFPDYDKYVVHPMDLSLMKENIFTGHYGSTEAFLADAQWILHNSIIFNTLQSKLTAAARQLLRSCRTEMGEIEACPECYAAAHARKPTWFTDVCTMPHILLWAKLKGFPYWPAKGMSINNSGLVDVRFFGAHDRAWVPAKDCFLFSEKDPNNFRTKRQDILDSMQEAEQHIRNISRKYGKFVYPPFKTQFDPTKLTEQLKMMIPSFEGEIRPHLKDKPPTASPSVKDKSRSNSKSSKGSHNGDTSESEEHSADATVKSRKMADGAVIAREEEQTSEDKQKKGGKTMEVDSPIPPPKEIVSRKRRRSEMEEAVITIISNSKEKKKKAESDEIRADEAKPRSSQDEATKENTTAVKEKGDKSQNKDNEPSSSTNEKVRQLITIDKQTLAPIKLVISTKPNKPVTVTKPTNKSGKVTPIKFRQLKLVKTPSEEKDKSKGDKAKPKDDKKSQKRRNSKTNKSLNNSNPANTSKTEKDSEKKSDNNSSTAKEKTKETESAKENKEETKSTTNKVPSRVTDSPKSAKERIQFDDDTSLAVIARESKTTNSVTGMPTISCVRSLSTTAQKTATTVTKTTANTKSIEITIDTNSDMRPRTTNDQSLVGRVGVRAFARMTSPEPQTKKPVENTNKDVQVEIKAEPMDLDDADRHMEKMDLMTAFRLQPVNTATSLREVRINKVVVPSASAKKASGNTGGAKPIEVRPRARKTFPQPKKADDGRSELNSKNSMVYIPIQPPLTPGPVRGARMAPVAVSHGPNVSRPTAVTSTCNNVVNTVTTPLVPSLPPPPVLSNSSLPSTTTSLPQLPSVGPLPTVGPLSSVGPLPTNVHTVPLITSVNGQWTFSLQPIMSVGGVDVLIQDDPPPLVNGLDRANAPASLVPIPTPVATPSNSLLVPSSGPMLTPIMPTLPKVLPNPGPVLAPTTTTAALPNSAPTPAVTPIRTPENVAPGEPPRLQQRPPLVNPLDAPVGVLPPPSTAGPLTAKLNQNAVKLADFFRNLLEDSLEKVDEPTAEVALLRLQLEQIRWRHKQELEEIKHNHELTVAEMRSSFEKEKARERLSAQADLEHAVKAAKAKQWCANCSQEAQFYCCWNTSYCDYLCQRAHWSQHFAVCTQQRNQDGENSADGMSAPPESRLQPQPDNIPKNTSAPSTTPALTVGGKVANRPTLEQSKTGSIIINLEKDASGNSKLKCVGTYKPPTSQPQHSSSIVLNKQMLNNDDSSKKVVTSGGYLIVGASNSTNTVVTPPRRTHTIQYYT